MTLYYLLRSNGAFSDLADYPTEPVIRSDGIWVEGLPTSNILPFSAPSLLSQLNTLFLTLSTVDQSTYLPYMGAVYALVSSNNLAEAKGFIAGLTVDSAAQTIQQAMLALFP